MKTIIYVVKQGYHDVAEFESLDEASKFFAAIMNAPIKHMVQITKGKNTAYYWEIGREFGIEAKQVDIYPTKKDALDHIRQSEKLHSINDIKGGSSGD
jgi:hypothetical protein